MMPVFQGAHFASRISRAIHSVDIIAELVDGLCVVILIQSVLAKSG